MLADPAGLDREELIRLAKLRVPISNFDRSKLSKDGYVVLVEDQDVRLPCKCASFEILIMGYLGSSFCCAHYIMDGLMIINRLFLFSL